MRWNLWIALLLTGPAARAEVALQSVVIDSPVNSAQPSVAVDPREGFVVTWQVRGTERSELKFAVLDKQGTETRRGTVASGSHWFVNGADFPNLAVLDNGDWVTFWLQKTSPDTYAYEVRSVRSKDAGRSWDAPIVIHRDGTDTEHGFVSMAPAGRDRVQLVWFDGRRMAKTAEAHKGGAEHMTLRTAVLGRSGKLVQEQELDDLTCSCCQTDGVRGATRTLFAYRDRSEAELRDIGTVVNGKAGWSTPRLVHADGWKIAGCPVNGPAVAAREDQFAVLWPTMGGGEMRVQMALGDGVQFGRPSLLAAGAAELGRVDLATWGTAGYLSTRVRQGETATELVIDQLDATGTSVYSTPVASKIGGYPRIARWGAVALLVWAEAGAQSGSSRLGAARITAPPGAPSSP